MVREDTVVTMLQLSSPRKPGKFLAFINPTVGRVLVALEEHASVFLPDEVGSYDLTLMNAENKRDDLVKIGLQHVYFNLPD